MSARGRMRVAGIAVAAALGLGAVPAAASADTGQSTNWAGYAVHRSGVRFTRVIGSWTQPTATCTPGSPAYSSVWVGLGGFSASSRALEQIGTEVDCSASGEVRSSAWSELVPAASRTLRLAVAPGDRVRAEVSVRGRVVTLRLADLTTHRSFASTTRASALDLGSAEWIVEAPSLCDGSNTCQTLPLADFGSAAFTGASAQTAAGVRGAIGDRGWTTTKIVLAQMGRRFIGGSPGGAANAAAASPSAVSQDGSAFSVSYSGSDVTAPTDAPRRVVGTVSAAVRYSPGGWRTTKPANSPPP